MYKGKIYEYYIKKWNSGHIWQSYMCHKQTFMQRIIDKAIGGIKLSDVQMDEIIKCGAKGGCIMSGMMSL